MAQQPVGACCRPRSHWRHDASDMNHAGRLRCCCVVPSTARAIKLLQHMVGVGRHEETAQTSAAPLVPDRGRFCASLR